MCISCHWYESHVVYCQMYLWHFMTSAVLMPHNCPTSQKNNKTNLQNNKNNWFQLSHSRQNRHIEYSNILLHITIHLRDFDIHADLLQGQVFVKNEDRKKQMSIGLGLWCPYRLVQLTFYLCKMDLSCFEFWSNPLWILGISVWKYYM